MDLFTRQYLQDIVQELQGPGRFRFVIQPLIAIFLGIRDGMLDAQKGSPPYLWHLLTDSAHRSALRRSGLTTISKPLFLAWLMDSIFQIFILGRWNPFQAGAVGLVLVALPYVLARALSNRNDRKKRKETEQLGKVA